MSGDETAIDGSDDESPQAVFHRQWSIYRKMVDHNYLFHREAYGCLHEILRDEAAKPFRFLDLGCGDAGPVVGALAGTEIAQYHGIDQSAAALDLARAALTALPCPATLEQRDFAEALGDRPAAADIVWIGLSLHHFQAPEKLAAMRAIRDIVGERGMLLIYEDTSPDGEDRAEWLRRWDLQQPTWAAYSTANGTR